MTKLKIFNNMLYLAIGLFALAAIAGVIIFVALMQKNDTPKTFVYLHGVLAASALIVLIVYSFQNPSNFPKISIILFVIAAIGGFYLFSNDLRKKPGPVGVAVIHAILAVAGFLTLLFFILG